MKRLLSLFLFIAFVLVSLNFGARQAFSFQRETPEVVINKYLDAVISNDYRGAYSLISDDNEDIREWLEFLNFVTGIVPEKLISTIHLVHSLTEYQVLQIDVPRDGTTVIYVESTVPDMEKIIEITDSVDGIKSLYYNDALPLRQKQGTFILVKERNHWKIREIEGTTGDSASEIAMDLAEKLLSEEDSLKLEKEIRDYLKRNQSCILNFCNEDIKPCIGCILYAFNFNVFRCFRYMINSIKIDMLFRFKS